MTKFKRVFCGILAAFFIFYVPFVSYAFSSWSVVEGVLTASSYFWGAILSACGIIAGDNTVSTLFGSWDSVEDYLADGEAGRLGAYTQWVYNNTRLDAAEEKYKEIESLILSSVNFSWGVTVSGIRAVVSDLKEFLKSCYGFGAWEGKGQIWHVPTVPDAQVWGVTEWSSLDFYPLPTTGYNVPSVAKNSNYTLFLTNYLISQWSPTTMNVLNWYFYNTKDVFGVYNVSTRILTMYERNAETAQYKNYSPTAYSAYVNQDGSFRWEITSTSWWSRQTLLCSPADAGNLPFPVFGSLEDAEYYVATGEKVNLYIPGTIPIEIDGFREDITNLPDTSISDTFIFPSNEKEAKECVQTIINIYPSGKLADVSGSLKTGGLDLSLPDIELPDNKKPVWLGWVIGEVLDWLLGESLDSLIDWLLDGSRDLVEDETRPEIEPVAGIKDRFPFCIPFDVIYLIRALESDSEIPRFEIPVNIDYEFIEYHEVFIVDFYDWITVVNILRVMLDIWFLAGLIVVTRDLMRG